MLKNTEYTPQKLNMGAKTWGGGPRQLSTVLRGDHFGDTRL